MCVSGDNAFYNLLYSSYNIIIITIGMALSKKRTTFLDFKNGFETLKLNIIVTPSV